MGMSSFTLLRIQRLEFEILPVKLELPSAPLKESSLTLRKRDTSISSELAAGIVIASIAIRGFAIQQRPIDQ
jgi:hypothetical protein